MKVAFWDNYLCERGTSLAIFDYAFYNQTILNNQSFVFYMKHSTGNVPQIIDKFNKNFTTIGVDNFSQVDQYLKKLNITHISIIKSGELNDRISKIAKNCIQCVFNCSHPHGDVYCSISSIVKGNNGKYPVLPHIVHLPKHERNMRDKLNIPNSAIVFGGYGGKTSFSIQYVHKVVYIVAKNNPHIYFVFANFNKFCPDLPNIIHLDMIIPLEEKVEFINTCDAMLWARNDGETFGLAIAEFSTRNKPVIASKVGDLCHVKYLGDKGIWYTNANDLIRILMSFDKDKIKDKDWNAYREFSPDNVMKIFKKIFLDKT